MRAALVMELGGIDRGDGTGFQPGARVYGSLFPPLPPLERGITGKAFAAHVDRRRLEALNQLVEAGTLRPQVEAVLPLARAREALARVAGGHTRGKIVLKVDQ